MSLKAFHVFFILISTIFAVVFGWWGVQYYLTHHQALYLVFGVGSFVVSLGLVWYGTWFLKKTKGYGYL